MKTLPLGTISHGTMRNEDLIPAFVGALRQLDPKHSMVMEYDDLFGGEPVHPDDEHDYLIDLFDALNEYVPPYCYFGASDGDGADCGVWIDWYLLDDAASDGELVSINSGESWPFKEQILEVNDHGNATLWIWDADEHRHVEVWSVV